MLFMFAKVRIFFHLSACVCHKFVIFALSKHRTMRYSIKCTDCGKTFAAETDTFGRQKYRCPYCQSVMTCEFNPAKEFWTQARSVVPVLGVVPVDSQGRELPTVPSKVVTAMDSIQNMGGKVVNAGKASGKRIHTTMDWLLDHLTIFFGVSFARVRRFRAEYADADLWLFFGFSILFIAFVIAGLFICAQMTKILVTSHSWILHEIPFLRGII